MNEEKKILSAAEADKLLAAKDGTAALLYLHILRTGGFSLTGAAGELRRSESEIALAAETLRRLGLTAAAELPLTEKELPEYTAADITARAGTDSAFESVVFEAQRALGKVLSSGDLKLLFGIYDHLGLPADVIFVLLHHCVEEYQRKNGAGRLPTMRYVEKEAWYWADMEIVTLDAAEEHICRERQKQEQAEQVKDVLQIRGRALAAGERKYVDAWLSLGYTPDAIAIAYDRTVVSTGKLTWNYMDKIIRSWAEKQLFTPSEIEAGDARRGGKQKPSAPQQQSDSEKLAAMRELYEHMKNSGNKEG